MLPILRSRTFGLRRTRVPGGRIFGGSNLGASIVEFAVVAPILLLMFMGIFEFGRLFYTRLTLQHAVREATRFAVTGNTLADPETGEPMSRAESITRVIRERAVTLNLDVDRLDIDPPDGGGPSQIVTVRGGFSFQFIAPVIKSMFPEGGYDFTIQTSMKNEPFAN